MAEFKRIKIAEIVIPERLRAVEEEHALAIAQSMVEHGQINPVTVRATPAAKGGKFTLVAGAHRIRACEINDDAEVDAMIVEADKLEGQLVEITENLFRNELSVIDRAVFVQSYRDIWEQKHGTVRRGGDRKSKRQVGGLIEGKRDITRLIAEEAAKGFGVHVAERMGISPRAADRLQQIAQHLHPKLKAKLRGTPTADNQSELLNLAKLGPAAQEKIVIALDSEPDVKKAVALTSGKTEIAKPNPVDIAFSKLVSAWATAPAAARERFLAHIRADQNEAVA